MKIEVGETVYFKFFEGDLVPLTAEELAARENAAAEVGLEVNVIRFRGEPWIPAS